MINIYLFILALISLHSVSINSNDPSEFTLKKVSYSTVGSPTIYHRTNAFGDRHGGVPPPPSNLGFYSSCTWLHRNPKGLAGMCACCTDICVRAFDARRENLKFLSAFTFPLIKHRPPPLLPHILTADRQTALRGARSDTAS